MAATLGIAGVLGRFPRELSSGQRQRVALGRAAARDPKVLLLDEPLSNLDAPMRTQLRREIARLHRERPATTIYVTHDQAEAMTLGQRVAVLNEGVLQQCAEPQIIYNQPANLFVAGFIGAPPMNLIRGRIERRGEQFVFRENNPAVAGTGSLEVRLPSDRGERLSRFAEGNMVLGIRAEDVSLRDDGGAWQGIVESVEPLGAETLVTFNTGSHTFIARVNAAPWPRLGERAPVQFRPDRLCFFNPASGTPIL
jgi:multiple sugar transport system ATP-binding protein